MKKKILSILLCLCMVAVLLPTTALAAQVEDVTFDYAYDVQREPGFPSTADKKITLKGLANPIMSDGSRGNSNVGPWRLTRVGTYSYVTGNVDNNVINNVNVENLRYIVGEVAGAYGISEVEKGTIVIHELEKDGGHIAYGVVLAYSETETEKRAVFIGDSLGSGRGGAGYLLSTTAQTGDVTVTAEMIATDFVEQTPPPSTPVVIIVPDDTADTTDPAKNPETGDNSTHLLWAVMASSALCAAALLFSSRRRGEEMQ